MESVRLLLYPLKVNIPALVQKPVGEMPNLIEAHVSFQGGNTNKAVTIIRCECLAVCVSAWCLNPPLPSL